MGGGGRPRKTKTQNPLCGHCVCTGVLIQGRYAVLRANKVAGFSDETHFENQGL